MSFLRRLFASAEVPLWMPQPGDWQRALERPLFDGFSDADRGRLQALAQGLIQGKTFTPVRGAEPTGEDIAAIASQAALPILHLGAQWYDGWQEVVLYPAEFVHEAEEVDEMGLVHQYRHVRAGEAWAGGPLVLSLDAVRDSGWLEGFNVVIHEFAHKLDMNNGSVNGFPPLHGDMSRQDWAAAFQPAYEDLLRRAQAGDNEVENGTGNGTDWPIDPYGAESPAEFFAVLSEYFFEWPQAVHEAYPAVYHQLSLFYRQDPLTRLPSNSMDTEPFHDPATP